MTVQCVQGKYTIHTFTISLYHKYKYMTVQCVQGKYTIHTFTIS